MIAANVALLVVLVSIGQVPEEALPPAGFQGAVGDFDIAARISVREVHVEEPVILTVRISATSSDLNPEHLKLQGAAQPIKYPPEMHPGRRLPALEALKARFEIDDLPDKDTRPDENSWEFSYRLRPRSTQVSKVPKLEYKFWNPATREIETSFSSSLALRVLPRNIVAEATPRITEQGLAEKYPFQGGAEALARQAAPELPAAWLLGLLLIGPPVLAAGWLYAWRRWFPDAARRAGRRRSRAARQALGALGALKALPPRARAERVAAIATQYLRARLDFPAEEPTPFEAVLHLQQADVHDQLAEEVGELFHACAAARFAAEAQAMPEDLARKAARLIQALEEQPCLSQPA